jgi:hypothetical protein
MTVPRTAALRCLTGGLPELGPLNAVGDRISFKRIVQTPGGISMQRNIIVDGSLHLPANIRQWYGDSRGHWEANARHRRDELQSEDRFPEVAR